MVKANLYSSAGTKKDTALTLDKDVFELKPDHDLLALSYRAYLANGRTNNATTLTRAMVRGGGKKPWKQKGTGRARAGSIRIPHWRGGGVVFGPSGNENYTVTIPTSTKRTSVRHALSLQASDGKLMILEDYKPNGKVSDTLALFSKLKIEGNILLVVESKTDMVDRSTRNLAGVTTISALYLTVYHILNADMIVLTKPAVVAINGWLGAKGKESKDE